MPKIHKPRHGRTCTIELRNSFDLHAVAQMEKAGTLRQFGVARDGNRLGPMPPDRGAQLIQHINRIGSMARTRGGGHRPRVY